MNHKTPPDYFPSDWKFGTDGIRGSVEDKMNPLFMVKLGYAAGTSLKEKGISEVLIGKDTRISGYMIESALEAGFISSGMDVVLLGPLPTPAVAYLAKSRNQAGLVITGSHNLYQDNGIKIFNRDGFKLSYHLEKEIEEILLSQEISIVKSGSLGKATRFIDAQEEYINFCKSSCSNLDLSGLSIVVDCGNGANYLIAPKTFSELGASVDCIGISPDGININQDCGSTNPEKLRKEVISQKADLGIGFDGDGDRLLFIDKLGKIRDGDDLLYTLIATGLNNPREKEITKGVVGTLMTNKSLEIYLKKENIDFFRADVGDKYILRELIKRGWILGGEPSGHIICLDTATTGDALIAALRVLSSISKFDFDISSTLQNFNKLPQELVNLKVNSPQTIIMNNSIRSEVSKLEKRLGEEGRVLLRPSGTEPLLRVMVEAVSTNLAKELAGELADFIQKAA